MMVAFIVVLAVQLLPSGGRTCNGQQDISIVYSGDVRGYIDPCG